jgi:hypothetical protein
MAGYAAEQRYEQAAGARDRLEALTRALAEARRAAALAGAEEIVLARPHGDGREVTVVRRGQLAAVGLVAADDQPGVERLLEMAASPELFDGPPPRHLADEVNLVTRWLEGAAGKAELLAVRGCLASPAIGGALLQLRYDPGRHRHAWPPGEARGRPEARPSRPRPPPPPRRLVRRRRFGERLADPVPRGDGAVRAEKDDGAVGVVDAEDEDFGLEAGDPPGREIDHAHDSGADEFLGRIGGDLGACHPFAEGAQVEADLVGRTAGRRELLDGRDQGRTDVDGEELPGLDGGQNNAGFGCLWHER